MVAIYEESGSGCLVHIVKTLEDAATWLNITRDALYKSLHLHGVMKAQGFIVKRV